MFPLWTIQLQAVTKNSPVARVVRAGVVHPNNDEDVLKVRANGLGGERVSTGLLEHNSHNVVPNVSLPQQLVNEKKVLIREEWDQVLLLTDGQVQSTWKTIKNSLERRLDENQTWHLSPMSSCMPLYNTTLHKGFNCCQRKEFSIS